MTQYSQQPTERFAQVSTESMDWNRLADILEKFCTEWESQREPPELEEFVPSDHHLRKLALVELVKIDLEYRSSQTDFRPLDDYLEKWPVLAQPHVPVDLVYEDYQAQLKAGKNPSAIEYCERFPQVAEAFRRLIGQDPVGTMSFSRIERAPDLQTGSRIDDFDLVAKIGSGAFANVYLARQISMQRLVALKVSADRGAEAQTLAQMDHPGIVRVYDQRCVDDPETNRKIRLLYMQYIPAGTLREKLGEMRGVIESRWKGEIYVGLVDDALRGRGDEPDLQSLMRTRLMNSDWPQVVGLIGSQLAMALHYAHENGVLHRDIKPANILIDRDGSPKLVDFNISSSSKVEGSTPASYFGGSLPYMSPEQLEACNPDCKRRPEELDSRSDIYSLGIVLIELLTSKRPFDEQTKNADWSNLLDHMILQRRNSTSHLLAEQKIRNSKHECPELLSDAILRCVMPDREERFTSARTLSRQLRWSANSEIQKLLKTPDSRGKNLLNANWVSLLYGAGICGLAAWFIVLYNTIESVPKSGHQTFWFTLAVIDGLAFPIGMAAIYLFASPINRAIYTNDKPGFQSASERNLLIGHLGALICASEWFACGFLFPAVLAMFGVPLTARNWLDFIGSNTLAGMVSAAYVFIGLTYLAVNFWQPAIIRQGTKIDLFPKQLESLTKLEWWIKFYELVAVSIPMLSMTFLVIRGDANNKLALTVLSIAGLVGFGVLHLLSQKVQSAIETLKTM